MPNVVQAQTSANVPTQDPAYQWINILMGARLITSDFPEQRPWSRLEFVRLIREARERLEKKIETNEDGSLSIRAYTKRLTQQRFLKDILTALEKEFSPELGKNPSIYLAGLERAEAQYIALGQSPQSTPPNGIGTTDGLFHPLVDNREGRHYLKGSNFDIQVQGRVQLSHYFTFFARPQIEITAPSGDYGSSINFYNKTLAVKTGWKNVEMEVGRDQVVWNAAPYGGLLFSQNARGLDMVQISTPHPFHLPWVLRKIGQFEIATLFSNLGPQYNPSYPWMMATQFAWHAIPEIRLSFSHQCTFGGSGQPALGWKQGILEYLLIPSTAKETASGITTNRGSTLAATFRIPPLRNMQIDLQYYLEDGSPEQFTQRQYKYASAYLANVTFPRLTYDGRLSAYAEFRYVGFIAYQHGTYTSGWALNKEFIALTDGPNTRALRVNLNYQVSPYSSFFVQSGYIRVLNNVYAETVAPNGQASDTVISSGPQEHHYVNYAGGQWGNERMQVFGRAGFDYVQNANFTAGHNTIPGIFQLGFRYTPELHPHQ